MAPTAGIAVSQPAWFTNSTTAATKHRTPDAHHEAGTDAPGTLMSADFDGCAWVTR